MPMVWSAENDAKLMAAIFQVYEVKMNGVQMKKVAEIMGPECTPKAISHRLSKMRKAAGDLAKSGADGETPKPMKAKTVKKKKVDRVEADDEEVGAPVTPPASVSKKRKIKKEESDDGLNDGVEIKRGEDVGEGLRAAKVARYDEDEDSEAGNMV